MNLNCPHRTRLADYEADELSECDRREMKSHLLECAGCSQALASHQQFITRLRLLPLLETSRDLAPLVLVSAQEQEHRRFPQRKTRTLLLWTAAAVVALCLLPLIPNGKTSESPATVSLIPQNPKPSLDRAIHWLCTHQEADGSWDAEKWGGNRNFQVALTAMSAIAVIRNAAGTPERATAAAGAVSWLRAQQTRDGTFSPENLGMPYNHSIATLALLHAHRLKQDPDLKRQLESAIQSMVRAQNRDGGWGWRGSPISDSPVTAWHIEALRLADELGIGNSRIALDCSLTWMAARVETGLIHPPSGLAGAKDEIRRGKSQIDLLDTYFLTIDLQSESSELARNELAEVRRGLVQLQISEGKDSGSWPLDHRWGSSGGRIYTTALASLALGSR
jgi:Squalene-hopene cyclase C-terminal domain